MLQLCGIRQNNKYATHVAFFMRIGNLFRQSTDPSVDHLVDILRAECSEFLNNPTILWRGVPHGDDEALYQTIPIRQDRRSLSGKNIETVLFNNMFHDRYGVENIRHRAMFCTNELKTALYYGVAFFVFPKNGAKVAYNEEIPDTLSVLSYLWHDFMDGVAPIVKSNPEDATTFMDWMREHSKKEMSPKGWLEGLLNRVSEDSRSQIIAVYNQVKTKFFPDYTVTSISNIPTVSTSVEFMIFDSDSFIAVSPQLLSEQKGFKADYNAAWAKLIELARK